MKRRVVLKILGVGGVAAALGGGLWLRRDHQHPQLAIDLVVSRLQQLDAQAIHTTGEWSVARTLAHLAQSIDFSMIGYPQMKSKVFQNTAGQLAFSIFNARGQMTHGLTEPIPGETIADESLSNTDGMNALLLALEKFDAFSGNLKPHFAYGKLSKAEYARAHVMHINNHFDEFSILS